MEVHPNAGKHGVTEEDIDHAMRIALVVADLGDGRILHLGPDRKAVMVEVIVQERQEAGSLVIHAMAMRARYEPYLKGLEESDD